MSDIEPINEELVFLSSEGEPITTSLVIATETGNEHASVIKLIRDNTADLSDVGTLRFEIAKSGGRPTEFAELDEPAAALLMTYLRNSPVVKDFKKRLVSGFFLMRRAATERTASQPLQGHDLMAAGYVEAMKQLEARNSRIYQLESARAVDAPKVTYVDTYVTDADLLSFSTVASTNGVKESWLRDLLIERDWIYMQSDSRWSEKKQKKIIRNRYSEKADKKRYFRRVEVHEAPRFRGSEVMHTLKITPAGAEAISRLIAREMAA
ncbi:phage regulator Rha-like protein [Mycobacterium frederiksbergense]|uniref:Phage regulator Rha-like protein n=1 Tax=Mycolicibacterium frederiksbergense TaxID=117567 RepID=A0ABT6LAI7_9MYCO|nr:Rha family transcriptional regulator [Mycolicibacterium frederiksbergense]MDH6199247.1 phage regulator Rha-like protein [Mycolicibacterium frederiksbergense]